MSRETLEVGDRVSFKTETHAWYPLGVIKEIDLETVPGEQYTVRWDDGVVSKHSAAELSWQGVDEGYAPPGVTPEFPPPLIVEVNDEMMRARAKGWSVEHDRAEGSGHLTTEVGYRLSHMGEYPTDAFVRHQLVVCIGLLVNAVKTLDWATHEDGHTVVLDPEATVRSISLVPPERAMPGTGLHIVESPLPEPNDLEAMAEVTKWLAPAEDLVEPFPHGEPDSEPSGGDTVLPEYAPEDISTTQAIGEAMLAGLFPRPHPAAYAGTAEEQLDMPTFVSPGAENFRSIPAGGGFRDPDRAAAHAVANERGHGLVMELGSSKTRYYSSPLVPLDKVAVYAPVRYKSTPYYVETIDRATPWVPPMDREPRSSDAAHEITDQDEQMGRD